MKRHPAKTLTCETDYIRLMIIPFIAKQISGFVGIWILSLRQGTDEVENDPGSRWWKEIIGRKLVNDACGLSIQK